MKKIFLFAAAALFAACSGDDLTVNEQPQVQSDPGAVGFEAYTQRGITRAGTSGFITTSVLKSGNDGFGVFGYYTDNNDYEQRATPNFFYNQQVKWEDPAWTYEPVKYWPNEYGDKAKSDDADKVTYFAYAPYVKVIPSSGKVANTATAPDDNTKLLESYGITGMSKNTSQGDPLVKYIASFNTHKSVDLCWGVADNNDGVWPTVQNDATMSITNGTPWLNVQRPANVDQKVKFTFKHATAQMRINIDAIVDEVRHTDKELDNKTRIWVRQVTFKGFAMKGTLNLNNDDNVNKPYWLDYNGQNELVAEDVTVYDGRKDGKEGVTGAIATNEKVLGLNPALVQDGAYEGASWTDPDDPKNTIYNAPALKVQGIVGAGGDADKCLRPGVTTATVNLFNDADIPDEAKNHSVTTNANASFFHVIPVDENFEVEIVYDVETVSENLAQNLSDGQTKGTSIENRIRKEITFSDNGNTGKKLQPGHSYTLNLHLGMNSVKFDAAVTDWIEEAAQDVDLPLNAPVIAAGATDAKVTLPYVQPNNTYTFAIYGLDGGESVTRAWTDPATQLDGWGAEVTTNAWSNGYDIINLTTKANPLTTARTQKATWTGKQSNKETTITFTQEAHPLFLTGSAANGNKYVRLARHNSATDNANTDWESKTTGWYCDPTSGTDSKSIRVWRNGIELDNSALDVTPTGRKFQYGDTGAAGQTKDISFADELKSGDVIMVTLKTGDAPEETITIKVL